MKKLSNKGFTLVELIIVIAILAIIMLIAIPNFSGIQHRMQVRADKTTAANIGKSVRVWYTEYLTDPAFESLVKNIAYVDVTDPTDGYKPVIGAGEEASEKGVPTTLAAPGNYVANLPVISTAAGETATDVMAHLCQVPKLMEYVDTKLVPKSIVDEEGVAKTAQYYFVGKTGSGNAEKIVVAIAEAAPKLKVSADLTQANMLFDGKPIPTTGATNNSFAYLEP